MVLSYTGCYKKGWAGYTFSNIIDNFQLKINVKFSLFPFLAAYYCYFVFFQNKLTSVLVFKIYITVFMKVGIKINLIKTQLRKNIRLSNFITVFSKCRPHHLGNGSYNFENGQWYRRPIITKLLQKRILRKSN